VGLEPAGEFGLEQGFETGLEQRRAEEGELGHEQGTSHQSDNRRGETLTLFAQEKTGEHPCETHNLLVCFAHIRILLGLGRDRSLSSNISGVLIMMNLALFALWDLMFLSHMYGGFIANRQSSLI
jgi:hypothetical protein